MTKTAYSYYQDTLKELQREGLYKEEQTIVTRQNSRIETKEAGACINFCANNYLGLAGSEELAAAAKEGLDRWGYGLSSVRFICGTQEIHKKLEKKLSDFLGMEDTILFGSCFDANGGIFECLMDADCAVISDELNHASIIDGVRLSKAKRWRYHNNDMADLERCLKEAEEARIRLIVTDGVFSMDGILANLAGICDLAETYDALVMVDDSHAAGFIGENGRGTPEACGVMGRVDILTGTLGKALGGASGGYVSAKREIVDLLRQKSRPYLFSNTLAPSIAAASVKALEMAEQDGWRRERLRENTEYFRKEIQKIGFDIIESTHPIVAILFYEAENANRAAEEMMRQGIYVRSFVYPVVPKGKARIRVQLSAAHTREELDLALAAFRKVKEEN
ncbi:glycine C-acetyltransferase [Cuneatibacter sp. NSJ-177]|uniref:glycine C-acetyltransferase n=1 Tax=Cuneatibacter sp. NSJ-177 TaxID=2931401 RepID=UPI001FD2EC19|nr:glycine C-acetyltransferase [Cuneatibacter sp. NSJ-177]MCJ7837366.1 glycine C-acetyltransferase [Cuneatibacter sp. NSJ-177]